MGRLNKKYFKDIKIASYRLSQGEEQSSPNAQIVSQRATKRYKIAIGDITEVLTLVPKEAGTLQPGEFRIHIDNGNVSKITNRSYTVDGTKKSL